MYRVGRSGRRSIGWWGGRGDRWYIGFDDEVEIGSFATSIDGAVVLFDTHSSKGHLILPVIELLLLYLMLV